MIEQSEARAATAKTPTPELPPPNARARSGHDKWQLSARNRLARYGVLIAPLVLVNAAAIYGQVQWAANHLTAGNYVQAVLFALTLESIAVYLAYEAHAALIAGDASFRLRAASYVAALIVGALNYSHFATDALGPTTAALAFGGLSTISPWLWSIRSRSLRREQLRAAGLIDPRSAHLAAAKWIHFPIRSLRAYRWSIDNGVQEERAAWDAHRLSAHARAPERARKRARHNEHSTAEVVLTARAPRMDDARPTDRRRTGHGTRQPTTNPHASTKSNGSVRNNAAEAARTRDRAERPHDRELLEWVHARTAAGDTVTGALVGAHYGVSSATGRRWLQAVRGTAEHPDRESTSAPPLHVVTDDSPVDETGS